MNIPIIPPISWARAGAARQVESIRPEVRAMASLRCMTYSSILQFPQTFNEAFELLARLLFSITGRNRPSVRLLRREIHPRIFDDPDLDAAVQVLFRARDRRAGAVTLGQNVVGEEFSAAVGQVLGDFRRTLFRECM